MNKHLRLRMLTLFSLLFFFSVSLFAQEKLVTIHLENVSLREIFSAIEKQTTYRFSYRNVVIDAKTSPFPKQKFLYLPYSTKH